MLFCSCFGKIPKSVKTSKPREEMPQTLIQFLGVDKSISAINEAMEQIPRMDSAVQDKLRPFVNKLSIKQEEENKDQPMSSQPDTDHILTNQELRKGDFLISENGKYKAVFQEDGNFVIFALCPIWATGTAGENPHRIIVQPDNNLVMYNGRNKPVWASDTWEEKEHEHSDKMCLTMTNEVLSYSCFCAPPPPHLRHSLQDLQSIPICHLLFSLISNHQHQCLDFVGDLYIYIYMQPFRDDSSWSSSAKDFVITKILFITYLQ
ncbi:uncharacterized protein LOC128371028 isoform X1 [Scomber scombrus]